MCMKPQPSSGCPTWAVCRPCVKAGWTSTQSVPSAAQTPELPERGTGRTQFAWVRRPGLRPVSLQQYALDAAVVGAAHVILQPAFAQNVLGHFHHDVVSFHAGVFLVA